MHELLYKEICYVARYGANYSVMENLKSKYAIHRDNGFNGARPWSFVASVRYVVCLSWNVAWFLIHVHSTKTNSLAPFFLRVASHRVPQSAHEPVWCRVHFDGTLSQTVSGGNEGWEDVATSDDTQWSRPAHCPWKPWLSPQTRIR